MTMETSPVAMDRVDEPLVLQDLRRFLSTGSVLDDKAALAMPVAAIKALLGVVQRSTSETMMGLQDELTEAKQQMLDHVAEHVQTRSNVAIASGCELFMRYITRTYNEVDNLAFEECRKLFLERGERFISISMAARDRIARAGNDFIQDGQTVLLHGWSRVVARLLIQASQTKRIRIICMEGRPDAAGAKAAQFYTEAGIPTTVVIDSAMGYIMEQVDMVLVGAEGVVENGGIVNKLGTYGLAICAKEHGTPFYVAAESYKFARLYPLNQRGLPPIGEFPKLDFVDTASWHAKGLKGGKEEEGVPGLVKLSPKVNIDNPYCDYTPAKFITLLFTDLGVLTPSAVSDELIQLYR